MESSLKERFARLERTPGVPPVSSGSPGCVVMTIPPGKVTARTISAAAALKHRRAPLLAAKRAMDALVEHGQAELDVPMIEDAAALIAELAACGIAARVERVAPAKAAE